MQRFYLIMPIQLGWYFRKGQVLGFKPTTRLEQAGDKHPECIKDRKHRHRRCNDSTSSCQFRLAEFSERTGVTQTRRRKAGSVEKSARSRAGRGQLPGLS